MTIQKIINNLVGMNVTDEFENDVICAFEDYEFDGETDVIVSKDESNQGIDYQAYIDHEDAPIICIQIENGKITDVWES